jgi:hypothetical protein
MGRPVGDIFSSNVGTHAIYSVAFALVAGLSLLATLGSLRMRAGSGDALRGSWASSSSPAATAAAPAAD